MTMKTIQTTLAAMMVALFLSSALVAQNNDAPAPLSSWHGREYTIDTKASTFAIDFTDTTLFSNTWRYMGSAHILHGYSGMMRNYFHHVIMWFYSAMSLVLFARTS
jgi:hypothetical protein